jgi:tRNA splicing ligase
MTVNVSLKNSSKVLVVDKKVFEELSNDPLVVQLDLFNNLRAHSSGCAVFQKTKKLERKEYETITIYIHRFIAEKFLSEFKTDENTLVGAKNGDKLDCRLTNLIWRSRSLASRMRKAYNKTGYTGVYPENNKYRAIISINGKTVHIGMYQTPEEAAVAYNKKSIEVYGERAKINQV